MSVDHIFIHPSMDGYLAGSTLSMDHIFTHPSVDGSLAGSTLSMDHIFTHPSVDGSLTGSTLSVTDQDAVVESLILFNLVSLTRIQISFLVQCMFQLSTLHLDYEILQKPFKKGLGHSGTEFCSTMWSWGHRGSMMLSDLAFIHSTGDCNQSRALDRNSQP